MAGPAAGILLPQPVTSDLKEAVRADIQRMSSEFDGDDFWIDGRPFILILEEEYEGELQEYVSDGIPKVIGWTPQGTMGFAAMCNDKQDHRLLGALCLHFVRKTYGLVDFKGALSPAIRGKAQRLFDEHFFGGGNDWADWEPHLRKMIRDLPGPLVR
jgi:hypothetical protein